VIRVADTGNSGAQEGAIPKALDVREHGAQHLGVLHILVGGSAPLDASDGLAVFGCGVLMTIHGILALKEVARQKGAAHIRTQWMEGGVARSAGGGG